MKDNAKAHSIILLIFILGGIGVPMALTGGCNAINPNQETLSQLEGLATVHVEELNSLTRFEAGYTLTGQDVQTIRMISDDARAIHETAKILYEPYRQE